MVIGDHVAKVSVYSLQEILMEKGKLFPEIREFPPIKVEELSVKACYSKSNMSIYCSYNLLKEPISLKKAVIMHELCHHVIFVLCEAGLVEIFDEIAAVKLHFDRDPKSFKMWMKFGTFLEDELRLLAMFSEAHAKLEKLKTALLRIIGVPIRGRPQHLPRSLIFKAFFTNNFDAKNYLKRLGEKDAFDFTANDLFGVEVFQLPPNSACSWANLWKF